MNQPGDFLKLLLPIFFLVLWAVSQIMNKQAAANQNRQGAGAGLGPRPGGLPPAPRPGGLPPAPRPGGLPPAPRPNQSGYREPERPRYLQPDRSRDDGGIVILPEELSRLRPAPRPSTSAERKPSKSRSKARRESAMMAPPPPVDLSAAALALAKPSGGTLAPKLEDLRAALLSPERVREALVLNELLGPPVSRRPRGRR